MVEKEGQTDRGDQKKGKAQMGRGDGRIQRVDDQIGNTKAKNQIGGGGESENIRMDKRGWVVGRMSGGYKLAENGTKRGGTVQMDIANER